MADVYRRPGSPYWYYDVTVGGKRKRKSTKRTLKAEARKVQQAKLKEALDAEQMGDTPEITLREALFDHYLPSKKSLSGYVDLERFCKYLVGDYQGVQGLGSDLMFHDLTSSMLRSYRSRREGQGMAPASINHELKVISGAYNMVKEDYRVRAGLKVPMVPVKGKPRFLLPDEEKALLHELSPTGPIRCRGGGVTFIRPTALLAKQRADNHDLVVMLLDTGARFGELAKLTWAMVDTKDFNWVHIYRTKVDNEGRLTTTSRVREVLKRRWDARRNSEYVFPGWKEKGDDTPKSSTKAIRRAMAKIGVNHPTKVERFGRRDVRSLRDTFATKLRQKGMSLDRLQELLGHSTPMMTQKYAHLAASTASDQAAAMLDTMEQDDRTHDE